jgi:protein-disulfide isomerase/plastocyanin
MEEKPEIKIEEAKEATPVHKTPLSQEVQATQANQPAQETQTAPLKKLAERVKTGHSATADPKPAKTDDTSMWNDMGTWRFVAGIVTVLLVVSIFSGGFSFGGATGAAVANPLSADDATTKTLDFVNSNLLQAGLTATLVGTEDVGDLYQVQLTIAGQPYESYITKDGRLLFPQGFNLADPSVGDTLGTANEQNVPVIDVSADDDPVKGDPNAPVTIIEFSDFECPFCGRFYTDTLPGLEEKYIKTGKVKLVYRDFPLESIHPTARPAAEAGECADDQGKFYEFHDLAFENQRGLTRDNFVKWAGELGLDVDRFTKCLDSNTHAAEVSKDLADGTAAGVTGTPAFFVNGRLLSGAQPLSAFEAIIEAELRIEDVDTSAEGDNLAAMDSTGSGAMKADAMADTQTLALVAKKFRFSPNTLTVKKGNNVELRIRSDDVDFGFVLPEFGVNAELTRGQVTTVNFVADRVGRFTFSCSNCDGKESIMTGTLVVQ